MSSCRVRRSPCICGGSGTGVPGHRNPRCKSRPGPGGPRARQDWVHEHAETGKPFTAEKQHDARREDGADRLRFQSALGTCNRQRHNGPPHVDRLVGVGMAPSERRRGVAGSTGRSGHKLSAIGSPFYNARSAGRPLRISALGCGRPQKSSSQTGETLVIHAAHSQTPLPHASPSVLAACPSRRKPLGGKVRWQRKFAYPARHMRHGLRF